MKKIILLTGATGFIGKNLSKNLNSKFKILSLQRKKKRKYEDKTLKVIEFSDQYELESILKKKKIDFIIHCATYFTNNNNKSEFKKIIDANISFGLNLLDIAVKKKIKKFINISTCWENYNSKKDNPKNLYSASKLAFSKLLNFYKLKNTKIKFYNIYLLDTFGSNDNRKKLMPNLKRNIKKNKNTNIISKNLYLNITNINDITKGIIMLLNRSIKAGDYSLINNKMLKISDILNIVKRQKKIKVKYLSKKKICEKIYNFKKIKGWKPSYSNLKDFADLLI